jgi:hypothetical protein
MEKKFLSREPNEALLCCAININYDFSDGLNSLSRLFKQDFRQLHFSVCFFPLLSARDTNHRTEQ